MASEVASRLLSRLAVPALYSLHARAAQDPGGFPARDFLLPLSKECIYPDDEPAPGGTLACQLPLGA